MPPLIELNKVYKTYQTGAENIHALDGISMKINRGEFVAIVGQSGSGKSTLMNILGCLDSPTSGDYILQGKSVDRLSDKRLSFIRNQDIGFVFQSFHLIGGLDALENVEMPLMYRGISQRRRRKLATDSLVQVGLEKRLHHRPNQMSGGQQQRVAIARAIASKPPIILADEPTGNLDSRAGNDILKLLTDLHIAGHTVILITHDNTIAASVPRVIRMQDGQIVSDERH